MHFVDHEAVVDLEVEGPRGLARGDGVRGAGVVRVADDAFLVDWIEACVSGFLAGLVERGGEGELTVG